MYDHFNGLSNNMDNFNQSDGFPNETIFSDVFFVFFFIVALLFIFAFISIIISGVRKRNYNNNQPTLSVNAKVVGRRTRVIGEHAHTYYYVTFEVESGDRMELEMEGSDYGMLTEGDSGILTFQGSRFKGFHRIR